MAFNRVGQVVLMILHKGVYCGALVLHLKQSGNGMFNKAEHVSQTHVDLVSFQHTERLIWPPLCRKLRAEKCHTAHLVLMDKTKKKLSQTNTV